VFFRWIVQFWAKFSVPYVRLQAKNEDWPEMHVHCSSADRSFPALPTSSRPRRSLRSRAEELESREGVRLLRQSGRKQGELSSDLFSGKTLESVVPVLREKIQSVISKGCTDPGL